MELRGGCPPGQMEKFAKYLPKMDKFVIELILSVHTTWFMSRKNPLFCSNLVFVGLHRPKVLKLLLLTFYLLESTFIQLAIHVKVIIKAPEALD